MDDPLVPLYRVAGERGGQHGGHGGQPHGPRPRVGRGRDAGVEAGRRGAVPGVIVAQLPATRHV